MGGNTDNLYPLYLIAAYLGEEEALYFAWQSFYTVWLGYLAIPGMIVSIYQLVTWNVDSCPYSFIWIYSISLNYLS